MHVTAANCVGTSLTLSRLGWIWNTLEQPVHTLWSAPTQVLCCSTKSIRIVNNTITFLHVLKDATLLYYHHVLSRIHKTDFISCILSYFSSRVLSAGHILCTSTLCTFHVTDTPYTLPSDHYDRNVYTQHRLFTVVKNSSRCLPRDWYGFISWMCGKEGRLAGCRLRKWGFTLI